MSSHFKQQGYSVWSGDVLTSPHFFQIAKLKSSRTHFEALLNELSLEKLEDLSCYLNEIECVDGWFVEEYAKERRFFTLCNAKKIEACRAKIIEWSRNSLISYDEHAILLASLIDSMDKVANTAGTYYAYLKQWHRKALKDFKFNLISPVGGLGTACCYKEDAVSLVKRNFFDIIYLDPPYNERSYSHYYHLPETIATEITPKVHGLSGIPVATKRSSKFNTQSAAKAQLVEILKASSFKLLVFHYADDGVIPPDFIRRELSKYGNLEDLYISSKGYGVKSNSVSKEHHVYLVQNG